jgi:aspartate carbamoyltransferase catalytic subunit
LKQQHVIEINDFSKKDLVEILDLAGEIEKNPEGYSKKMNGKNGALLFFEPSTRTKDSFASAIDWMGGKTVGFDSVGGSSLSKGESLADTISMYAGFSDVIIMRHNLVGSAKLATEYAIRANTGKVVPVINGGDGDNQHPTQTMLDLYTIRKELGQLEGLNIALVGDLRYGRTVHSLLYGAALFNMNIRLVSPELTRMPENYIETAVEKYNAKIEEFKSIAEVIRDSDVIYMTRMQEERFSDPNEYKKASGQVVLTPDHMERAKKDMIVMHPLPRIDEIDRRIDSDKKRAAYLRQAENGVPVRQAILLWLGAGQ